MYIPICNCCGKAGSCHSFCVQCVVTKYLDTGRPVGYDAHMATRTGPAHVVTTTRHYKGRLYRTHLLRRSYRDGGRVKNETLGNLSHLPEALIALIRRSLQGETFVPLGQAFEIVRSRAHGHAHAVATAMQRLGVAALIASKP